LAVLTGFFANPGAWLWFFAGEVVVKCVVNVVRNRHHFPVKKTANFLKIIFWPDQIGLEKL